MVALMLWSISLAITTFFYLLFPKTVKEHCKIKTTLTALSISSTVALGIICFGVWAVLAAFGEMSRHPIQHGVSVVLGIFCFFLCIILIALYFKIRLQKWSVKGFIIDILTGLTYLPTFFFSFEHLYKIISQ